ncbi:MAG: DUF6879 family protein [Pseudonocardiaceae bacterium]
MNLLSLEQLTDLVETTQRDFFRIETLPSYDTTITTSEYRRWLDDEPEPDWEARRPWLDKLAQWAKEGRPRRRVRVIHDPITDYERYACEWSYPSSVAAGELIRVLDISEQASPRELAHAPGDWSLIDGRKVVKMHYDSHGQFVGAQHLDIQHVEVHRLAADAAWKVAEPFERWWVRHPQHRRQPVT